MYGRVFLSALLLCSILLPVSGQQPPRPAPSPAPQTKPRDDDQEVVRITTNLVQVDVVVTRDGKQVTDLKPEDFELFEDGRPQQITSFSYISNVPGTASSSAPPLAPTDKTAPVVPAAVHPHDVRRTVAFVVDDLGMSNESVSFTRHQLRKFVDEQLQPNDLVAIIRTGGEVGALQQFTTDKRLLHSAIEHLKWNYCSRVGVNVFPPVIGSFLLRTAGDRQGPCGEEGGANASASLSALQFVVRGMGTLPGRKAMVILSDSIPISVQEPDPHPGQTISSSGKEGGSVPDGLNSSTSYEGSLRRLAEMAIRASVVIYAVDTRGLQYTGPTAADAPHLSSDELQRQNNALSQNDLGAGSRSEILRSGREGSELMSRQTGGFRVRNSNDFGIDRVLDDQRGYYLLGYRPSEQTFNRRFHQIKARIKQKGLTLRTRAGFFGVTEDEARLPELTSGDQMRLALMSPFGGADINLRLTTFFANEASGGSLLRSFIYLNARELTFTDTPEGTHAATFDLSTVMFGDNGKVLDRQDRTATLRLGQESYERVQHEGVVYSFDVPVKHPGALQFRVAVRDQASGRIGAAGQFVGVPNLNKNQLALSGIVLNKEAGLSSDDPAKADESDIAAGPAVRQFRQGPNLIAVYAVYNALVNKATQLPQLTTQFRIFRDGKAVFSGAETPLNIQGQTDLRRLLASSRLQLGPDLSPGAYVLQVIVEDHLGKEKTNKATQWIDFEVIK